MPDRHAHTRQLSSHLFDIRHVEYSDLTLMEMFASRGGIHHRAGPSALHSAARARATREEVTQIGDRVIWGSSRACVR